MHAAQRSIDGSVFSLQTPVLIDEKSGCLVEDLKDFTEWSTNSSLQSRCSFKLLMARIPSATQTQVQDAGLSWSKENRFS